jgi:cupin 2 domain-containing protein
MPNEGNLFAEIASALREEEIARLFEAPGILIERIVSNGQMSPPGFWYDQAETEWVLVVRGAAEILFEDENVARKLKAGDYLVIAPHRRHRVTWTDPQQPTIWLAIHIGDNISRVPGSEGPLSSTVLPSGSEM